MWSYAVIARAQSRMRECVSLEEKGFSKYSSTVQRNQDAHRTPYWAYSSAAVALYQLLISRQIDCCAWRAGGTASFALWHQLRSYPLQGSVFKRGFRTTGLKSELESRQGYLQAT